MEKFPTMTLQELQNHIGKKVRQLRQQKVWSLEALANKTDSGVSYISEVENGKRNPTIEKMWELATALEVEVRDLLP